eukprot:COSAG02_NODE_6044_length_3846_cov_10.119295_3_plen_78_part_00
MKRPSVACPKPNPGFGLLVQGLGVDDAAPVSAEQAPQIELGRSHTCPTANFVHHNVPKMKAPEAPSHKAPRSEIPEQ